VEALRAQLKSLPGDNGVHAKGNGVFAVYCNQVDFNGHSTHQGGACVIDPMGDLVKASRASLDDLMITAELDPEVLARARRHSHFTVKTRRPEVYGELTQMI
jgi:predicted amidohydrolase